MPKIRKEDSPAPKGKDIPYEFIDHTADAKFCAYGQTIEEAFANAALATAALMWNPEKIKPSRSIPVEVRGRDLQQLLMAFLEEVLFALDVHGLLLKAAKRVKINKSTPGFRLQADFIGDRLTEAQETFGDVKAVTYNEMKIEHDEKYRIQVVVDM